MAFYSQNFTLIIFIICESLVIATSAHSCRTLKLSYQFPRKRLTNHTIRTIKPVTDLSSCTSKCFMEPICSSINYCTTKEGKSWCDLVNTDEIRSDEYMESMDECMHYSSEGSCNSNPCSVHGKCSGDYLTETPSYKCICEQGYEGTNCEKDIDECATNTHSCDSRLNCENLPGSFKCICQQGQPAWTTLFDFESGKLTDWTITGTAFNNQPTFGDNPTARNRRQPSNHVGDWWIGTFENRSSPSHKAGEVQNDGPIGTILSKAFIIRGKTLRFRIGGGCNANDVFISLLIDGKSVRKEIAGVCSETMQIRTWDVEMFIGKEAKLLVADNSSEGWGHINFDHFEGRCPE